MPYFEEINNSNPPMKDQGIKPSFFRSNVFMLLILLLLSFFPLFYKLGMLPIQLCDESRLAVNAAEMYLNNDFLITYFNGKSDYWNTKPPFLIWSMVLSMKVFGPSEFSFRLPVAIFAFITICILFFFCSKVLKNWVLGFISVLVLLTSSGYINYHAARSGDYDAALTMWTTLYLLSFFQFLDPNVKNKKTFLALFTFGLVMAVMTKGIAALIFMPGLLIYTILQKQFLSCLKNKYIYYSIFAFLTLVGGYYLLRERFDPGYLKSVNDYEIQGNYLNDISGGPKPFWFYFKNLLIERFTPWIYLLPLSVIFLFRKNPQNRIVLFCLVCSMSFLTVISFSKTIFPWYDVPVYPLLSIIAGIVIFEFFSLTENYLSKIFPAFKSPVYLFLIAFVFFSYPYYSRLDDIYHPDLRYSKSNNLQYGPFIKALSVTQPQIKNFSVLNKDCIKLGKHYSAHLLFYMELMNHQGYKINTVGLEEDLKPGNLILVCEDFKNTVLNKLYDVETISIEEQCWLYKIIKRKQVAYPDVLVFNMIEEIKKSTPWYEQIKSKSEENHVLLENQLLQDALYMLQSELEEIDEKEAKMLKHKYEIKSTL